MKKFLTMVGVTVIGMASASAYILTDIGAGGGSAQIVNPGTSLTRTFDLTSAAVLTQAGDSGAYDPVTQTVGSAFVTFILQDVVRGFESITIDLEGEAFASAENFSLTILDGTVNLTLLGDNMLTYTITSAGNSVVPTVVASAVLEFTAVEKSIDDPPISVPDGGSSLALLGIALMGLSWAGAKRMRS